MFMNTTSLRVRTSFGQGVTDFYARGYPKGGFLKEKTIIGILQIKLTTVRDANMNSGITDGRTCWPKDSLRERRLLVLAEC